MGAGTGMGVAAGGSPGPPGRPARAGSAVTAGSCAGALVRLTGREELLDVMVETAPEGTAVRLVTE